MKQGSNTRGRPRGRVGGGGGKRTPNRNQTFDSNGPGVRLRGNALQLVEKYTALARDAGSQGDRVLSENYLQHADHYHRVYMALTGQVDGARASTTAPQTGNRSAVQDRGQGDDLFGETDADSPASAERERPTTRAASRRGNGQDREETRDPEPSDETVTVTDEESEDTADAQGGAQGNPSSGGTRSRSPRRTGRGTSRASTRATTTAATTAVEDDPNGTDQGNGSGGDETGTEGTAEAGAEADATEGTTRTRRIRRNPRRASTTRASGGGDSDPGQPTAEPSVA